MEIFPAERRKTMDNGLCSYNRFLSGDKDAIDEIIRDYKDGLVYYLFSITRDMQLAEEAAIDAFVKLYVEKPAFKGSGCIQLAETRLMT